MKILLTNDGITQKIQQITNQITHLSTIPQNIISYDMSLELAYNLIDLRREYQNELIVRTTQDK